MARQTINIGTIQNDGTGDKLRDAMDKVNDNFLELYTELGGESLSNLDISGNTLSSANSNGDIILDPNGTGKVKIDNLAISGNTLSSTDTNGNITLDPAGTGSVVLDSPVSITGTLTLSTSLSANVIGNLTGDVTGTVSSISNHTTTNLIEGTNLYYTNTRARAALSATGSISYDSGSGVISYTESVTSVNGETGAVVLTLSDIAVDGQLDGDLVGSVFGNDSTILVDGGANEIVGTINSTSGTITTLNATTITGFTTLTGAGDAIITAGVFYGDETQVDRYLMKDSSIVIDETGTLLADINNSTSATFSGTVNLNGATVSNASFNLTGNLTGVVDGDLIGSVFGDDSTTIIDGINKTGTLTELDVDDINIDGNTISAAGAASNQNLILNVKGVAALETNSDTISFQPRTDFGLDGIGAVGDADNLFSQNDDYLYKSTVAYDGSTLIWKRAKLRYFNEPLFYVGADDSTMRGVGDLEGIKIIGGTNVSTSSDAEGNITIDATDTGITDVVSDTTPQLGGDLDVNGFKITTARSNEDLQLEPNGTGTVVINSGLRLEEGTQDRFSTLTGATGTVAHDCANGNIFYHTSISANFTANFTNLQLDTSYATAVTLVLVQGGTAYIPNVVQIGGAGQTINWQGNSEPTGTTSRVDTVSLTILNNSGSYTVLGQLTDF